MGWRAIFLLSSFCLLCDQLAIGQAIANRYYMADFMSLGVNYQVLPGSDNIRILGAAVEVGEDEGCTIRYYDIDSDGYITNTGVYDSLHAPFCGSLMHLPLPDSSFVILPAFNNCDHPAKMQIARYDVHGSLMWHRTTTDRTWLKAYVSLIRLRDQKAIAVVRSGGESYFDLDGNEIEPPDEPNVNAIQINRGSYYVNASWKLEIADLDLNITASRQFADRIQAMDTLPSDKIVVRADSLYVLDKELNILHSVANEDPESLARLVATPNFVHLMKLSGTIVTYNHMLDVDTIVEEALPSFVKLGEYTNGQLHFIGSRGDYVWHRIMNGEYVQLPDTTPNIELVSLQLTDSAEVFQGEGDTLIIDASHILVSLYNRGPEPIEAVTLSRQDGGDACRFFHSAWIWENIELMAGDTLTRTLSANPGRLIKTFDDDYIRLHLQPPDGHFDYRLDDNRKSIRLEVTTSTNEYAPRATDLTLYPNPVSDQLYIEFDSNKGSVYPLQVEIYSANGHLVQDQRINANTPVSMRSLAPGVYFVRTMTSNGSSGVKSVLVSR